MLRVLDAVRSYGHMERPAAFPCHGSKSCRSQLPCRRVRSWGLPDTLAPPSSEWNSGEGADAGHTAARAV